MSVEQVNEDVHQAKLELDAGWRTTLEAEKARTKVAEGLGALLETIKDLTVAPLQADWTETQNLAGAAEIPFTEGKQILETTLDGSDHPAGAEALRHATTAHSIITGDPEDSRIPALPGLFSLGAEDLEFIETQLGAVRDRITTALGHTADVQTNFAHIAGGVTRLGQHVPGEAELAIQAATQYQEAILATG
ncbi:MAG TPA: hypothetical protein VLH86_02180 [Patescibacteria group bacterium]|nr:hypothetical protein [Patescibacteria group bacterium]